MRYLNAFAIACLPLALSAAACSSAEDPPASCNLFNYNGFMAGATARTLDADVFPILSNTTSCATVLSCHGGTAHPPSLGGAGVTAATVRAGIVGVNSTEVPTMKYVVPGAPQESYLMRKLESTNPGCGLMCTPPVGVPDGCSTRMPSGMANGLPADQIAIIRDWIKQGAN